MFKNILNLEGVTQLDKQEQIEIGGGNPFELVNHLRCMGIAANEVMGELSTNPLWHTDDQQEFFNRVYGDCMLLAFFIDY